MLLVMATQKIDQVKGVCIVKGAVHEAVQALEVRGTGVKDEVVRGLIEEGLALAVKHSGGFVTPRVIDDFARTSVLNAETAQRFWRYACFGFWLERFEVRC